MQTERTLFEQIKLDRIWDFPGGIHPPERKSLSNTSAIATMPCSDKYFVPIKQHIGSIDDILVSVGDEVLANQPLTAANLTMTVPVHSPVAGKVLDITQHVSAHPSAKPELCIVIEPHGNQSNVAPSPLVDWQSVEKYLVIEQLKIMGLSGLGGAGFPTHIKMHPPKPIEVLILNGVECEPYITADDVLMRHHASEIVTGAQILQHVINSKICIIAIEDNKPEAIEAMREAVKDIADIEVRVVPTKYPSGGEKQLIQLLTGQQVPSGGIPADLGIVMQNVGTAHAVKRAVIDGLPLTERVVTITGESVQNPQNVWAKIGTPVNDLLVFAGFKPERNQRLIMGGPMMGFAILDTSMPVVKITNCILAPSNRKLPEAGPEQACIRCGLCADACPAELLPQQLQWFAKAKDHDKLNEYNLFDCIECGACAYVCPSQIPLVQYYRSSKAEIRSAEHEKMRSEKARERFEARQERLEREKQARLEKHKAAAEKRAAALAKDNSAKDKIAAALARAKAKKAGAAAPTDEANNKKDLTPAQSLRDPEQVNATSEANTASQTNTESSAENDRKAKVAEAIARAKAKKAGKANEVQPVEAEQEEQSAQPEQDERKAKVAAAIARAKAKKANAENAKSQSVAKSETETTVETGPEAGIDFETSPNVSSSASTKEAETSIDNEDSPEAQRKAKVAAAIARAKEKKANKAKAESQSENAEAKSSNSQSVAQDESNESSESALTPEEIKKQKVAAAIAKAKAKRQPKGEQ